MMIKGLRYRIDDHGMPVLQMLISRTSHDGNIRNEMDIWHDVPTIRDRDEE